MLQVRAFYDGQNFQLPQPVAVKKPQNVLIQFLDEDEMPGPADLEAKFEALFQQWWAETAMFSGGAVITENPHYLKIIALGEAAIPLILRKLEAQPCMLFPALREITGANPVPETHAGNLKAMTQDWLDWGRANRYR